MIDKQKHRALRTEIDRLLWEEWDPIGVNDAPEARDEYRSYAGGVCTMLWDGKTRDDILAYLHWAESDHMGTGASRETLDARNAALLGRIFGVFQNYKN
ncbi:MAG: hypothetical protein J0L97_06170 [Alphaproteobacteria bacterium]|nr:hypothetical protein [Alphaproteobacteria bacterium]